MPQIKSILSTEEIFLDQFLETEIWFQCFPSQLNNYDGKIVSDDWKTSVRSIWTEKNIYFYFEAKFKSIRTAEKACPANSLGKTPELWDVSDVLEIFIGPNSKFTRKYRELQVAPDSRWIDLALDASGKERIADFNWCSGMKVRSVVDEERKVWYSVFQVPNTAFSEIPEMNSIWNLNFYRISGNPDEKIYLAWAFVNGLKFHKPEMFGDILFTK